MFLHYYGLREQPFGVTPNPRFLYHGPAHREALASLIYGIEADLGFAALIAEPGMGKTTLLFYLLEKFRPTARTALVFQTQCTPLELLRYVANELEVEAEEDDPVVLNDRIRQTLVREARARRRVILIVDEAQNLSEESLEAIRLLSDFETPDFKLLHIILAGQPRLAEKLAQPGLSQLLQRIAMLNRLLPFTAIDDVARYISYRLKVAGYSGPPLFTQDGLELIAEHSAGIPRQINRLCFNALSLGCVTKKRHIDAEIVREVVNDLDMQSLMSGRSSNLDKLEDRKESSAPSSTTGPLKASGSSARVLPNGLPVSSRSLDKPTMAPEMVAAVSRGLGTDGALALSPVAEHMVRGFADPLESARTRSNPRTVARPQLAPTREPAVAPRKPAVNSRPIQRPTAPAPAVVRKSVKPADARGGDRVSLALIVLCVIAVPLLALAAWRYAERQHLLPAPEQPTTAPAQMETKPGSVESGDSVSLPPAPPNNQQKSKKQPPRSQLRLGPTPIPAAELGTRPGTGGIELKRSELKTPRFAVSGRFNIS